MALTQSAWTRASAGNQTVVSCSVAATTAENDAYTLALDTKKWGIDPHKPFTLFYYTSATPDGVALPLDVWIGYASDFALTGDSTTVAATSGAKFKQLFDDVVLAVTPTIYSFEINPSLPVADVVTVAAIGSGAKATVPPSPYYAFNANGGSTLNAATHYFKVVQ